MPGSPQEIFESAIGLQPRARDEYLRHACGEDEALRTEVGALLRVHDEAPTFLASPTRGSAAAGTAIAPPRESEGQMIGRYKLLQPIGEGGFGSVWMAEQREPVKRRVALKIIKLGMDTRQVIARFEAERQALAMMDHPNIAKVLDAGSTETGRPYFVMEYIKGVPILEYCDTEKLDTRARLGLFTSVCHAIQHAHQKGIIHRDIKPGNVLITMHDGVPVPKVIDFGIAKATSAELTQKTLFTEHRQMIGTPAYMSPEQAEMSGLDIDTRSDIYSLGVLLYELLTGTTPFSNEELRSAGFAEMMRMIREVEPHKPSTRLSTLGETATKTAQQRRSDTKKLGLVLRGDLDWIVMKCLEKDRTRRYETANGLASDINRHLNDEPVTAGPPSAGYRVRKFVKRNRGQVIVACVLLFAMLAGILGGSWGLIESNRARSIALQNQLETEQRTAADNARLARNAEAVTALLGQCEESLRTGDAAKARVALDAARKRSAEGGAEKDAERLSRLSADLDLLNELDAIDRVRWTWTDYAFASSREIAAKRMGEALNKYGADPEAASAASAAATVNSSAVRERILASLDWLLRRDKSEADRALLRRLDFDPYRNDVRDAVLANDTAKMAELADRPAALEQPWEFAAFMGESGAIGVDRRVEVLRAAVLRCPARMDLLMTLGYCYPDRQNTSERIRWYQAAIAADPRNSTAYNNLGVALMDTHRLDEALGCFRNAIAIDPNNFWAQINLAGTLRQSGQRDEAVLHARKALAIDPTSVHAIGTLGKMLAETDQKDESEALSKKAMEMAPGWELPHATLGMLYYERHELYKAIASFRKGIALDPTIAEIHENLGSALDDAGQVDEAIVSYRRAIELDPKECHAHYNLGLTLHRLGRSDEAIALFRTAAQLDPKYIEAHIDLGNALGEQGRSEEAMAVFRKALEFAPKNAWLFYNMGIVFARQGQVDGAITNYRKAIELDPHHAEAHCNLGDQLRRQGHFTESLAEFRRGDELGKKRRNWSYPSGEWVHDAELRVAMEERLPAYLKGEFQPGDTSQRIQLAFVCQGKKLNHAAAGIFAAAFAADPKATDDFETCYRANAACVAALSAAGEGEDAANLTGEERARLRKQALNWLRADLSRAASKLETGDSADRQLVARAMHEWLNQSDLASIRDSADLARLPADERSALTTLWADVADVSKRAEAQSHTAASAAAPSSEKEGTK